METEIINEHQLKIINTSIFSDESLKKGINRLMNSPVLDFICSMPDSKWENFQRQFFDYYYNFFKEYSGEIGFESLRGKRAKIFNIYDDGTLDDNKELVEKLKNINDCKYEGNGDFKYKYEQSEFGRLTENMIDRLQKEECLLYDNDVDVKDYLNWYDKVKEIKEIKEKTLTKTKEIEKK